MGERLPLLVPRHVFHDARRMLVEMLESRDALTRDEYLFLMELLGVDLELLRGEGYRAGDEERIVAGRESGRGRMGW